MKEPTLEKRAKAVIMQMIMESGKMDREEIVELIRPHFNFYPQKAKEQALKKKAGQLAAEARDENGVRTIFNCKDGGTSSYINVDVCEDLPDLQNVEEQLNTKLTGLSASTAKVRLRRLEVEGQLSLDLEAGGEGAK